jgi:hypothetical protein
MMAEKMDDDVSTVMEAYRQYVHDLPDDLSHLPLSEFGRRRADPAERARIEPAARRFAETVAPIVEKWRRAADGIRQAILAPFERFEQAISSVIEPVQKVLQRPRVLGERLQEIGRLAPQVAAEYCRPYQRQIAQLREPNIRPLSRDDMMEFMIMGILITPPEERALGYRPPLEWVTVACRRLGLATAILSTERPQLVRWTKRVVPPQDLDDLPPEVFLTLCETVLPNIERRLGELTPEQSAEKLKGWMSDQYLVAAIRRNLVRSLKRRRARQEREVTGGEAGVAAAWDEIDEKSAAIDRLALGAAVEEYLSQSKRPELDRAILEALREGRSMSNLARERKVPERTLRQRKTNLVDFCAQRLGLTE